MPADAQPTEVVSEFPGNYQQPFILPKVAFNSSTTLESPAFWFLTGMVSGFVILYFLKRA